VSAGAEASLGLPELPPLNGPYATAVERFPHLRQSRLATFDRCALSSSFEEEYESGWSSHAQARGTIFHRVAAKCLTEMYGQYEAGGYDETPGMGPGMISTDAAIAILDETLRQQDIDVRCPKPKCGQPIVKRHEGRMWCSAGHDHRSDFVNLPLEQVKDLRWVVVKWAHDNVFDIENLIDVEQRILAPITYPNPEGGAPIERILTGQLDALFVAGDNAEEFIVIDWKDSWGLPGPTSVGFDGYFQQRFYAWLVFKNYPTAERVTLREFYVRFSEAREATVFRSDIADVEADLSALAERFDQAHAEQNFPPTPGVHCNFCPRPGACPIFPGVRAEGMITDKSTAKRIAREITVAEAAIKSRKAALSAYTSAHGPEEVSSHKGKRVWGHKPVERTSRPNKKQMEEALIAQRSGVPIRIDDLYRTSVTTRFELHTPEEHEDIEPEATDAALMAALEASVASSGSASTVAADPTEEASA
jgi:hypothetical protein